MSKATLHSTLNALCTFFKWLADKPGFKSRITYSDADYFSLSKKDTRIATTNRERPVPTLEQIEHVIRTMPSKSEIERRDRAIIAFTILTGARDSAIASLRLKHINLVDRVVEQDAREVKLHERLPEAVGVNELHELRRGRAAPPSGDHA